MWCGGVVMVHLLFTSVAALYLTLVAHSFDSSALA